MRRRKSAVATTVQTNVRLERTLLDEIEARAKERHTTLSTELRRRLIEAELSLADFLMAWRARARDVVERSAREEDKNIVDAWRFLQQLDALFAKFYTDTENLLMQDRWVAIPEIRKLLRGAGAPVLPGETKAKSTQQE